MEKASKRHPTAMAQRLKYRVSQGFLLLVASFFAIQIFSPLRLNTDAITLLSMADSAAHGGGFLDGGQRTVFPPGYPALLAVLMRSGTCHSWSIIALNLGFLFGGLFSVYYLLVREFGAGRSVSLLICAFFLLSFVVVKHFTIPLTDVPFFCCSMSGLAVMSLATRTTAGWRFWTALAAAWLLALTAITVRRVGVAFVPALVFFILQAQSRQLFRKSSWYTNLILITILILAISSTIYTVVSTSTLAGYPPVSPQAKWLPLLSDIIGYRVTELGELVINVPLSKTPAWAALFLPMIGLILLLLAVFGIAAKSPKIGPIEVFLASYMTILLLWPYYDTRFWLPVIPLLIGYSLLAIRRLKFSSRVFVVPYCAAFAVLGFVAIAYSTRISLAGPSFPDRYGDGTLRATYCAAFKSCRNSGNPGDVNAQALHLLRRYD